MSAERDLLAAEYVLGTLPSAERDAAIQLRTTDSTFDRAVVEWEGRLAPLNDATVPITPNANVWRQILSGLIDGAEVHEQGRSADASNVVVLNRAVKRWRVATFATGALAAGLAFFTFNRDVLRVGPAPSTEGAYVAAVNRGGDMPALIVRVDLATHAVTVRPIEAETPAGKSLELWFVGAGQVPKSLGVVGKARERMPMPSDMEMKGAVFAVSVEPPGGSPTGAPTGPVVYKGMLVPE